MIKEVKDLYAENYKTFIQEIEDDSLKMIQRNGKIFYALGRINIINMALLPKAIYRFNATLITLLMTVFKELEQIIHEACKSWVSVTQDSVIQTIVSRPSASPQTDNVQRCQDKFQLCECTVSNL